MARKNNSEKSELVQSIEEIEELDEIDGGDATEPVEHVKPDNKSAEPKASDASEEAKLATEAPVKASKPVGEIEAAISGAFPMIEEITAKARAEAQRASEVALHEYRCRLQAIMQTMQETIKVEGTRVAEQIGARLAEQIRNALMSQTEEKTVKLVDEFVHVRQSEAETMSINLLALEKAAKAAAPAAPLESKNKPADEGVKKHPEIEQQMTETSEAGKKVVFDFASFISRSKVPV